MLLEQGLEDMNKTKKQDIDEATLEMASTEAVLAEAERNLAAEMTGLREGTRYLSDPERDCQVRVQEFERDTTDDIAELAALGKVEAILPEEFALALMGSCVRLSGDCCGELDGRDGECGDDTGSDVDTQDLRMDRNYPPPRPGGAMDKHYPAL